MTKHRFERHAICDDQFGGTMNNTWILILDRVQARLFERIGRRSEFKLIQSWSNPEGRLKNSEIVSDSVGRDMNPRVEFASNPQFGEVSPKTEILRRFCGDVATYLEQARIQSNFDDLVLVAEPRTLGAMRSALSTATAKLVKTSLQKDLCNVDDRDIPEFVLGHIV